MQKLKEIGMGLVVSLCELVVGLLLLVNPVSFTAAIITVLGAVLTALGIVNIVAYFRNPPQAAAFERRLSKGILEIAGGLFCVVNPGWFIAAFPVLTILYGIGTLVSGVVKIEFTMDMIRMKTGKWGWCLASAVITLICAAVILMNPFTSTAVLWYFVAVSLIVEAIVDFVTLFIPGKGKSTVVEGEVGNDDAGTAE